MILQIILTVFASIIVIAALTFTYLWYWAGKLPKVKVAGIRVACVGDSITQGMGVMFNNPDKNSYPALLQEMLGSEYQVLNYGHSGRTLLLSGDQPYRKSHFFTASLKCDSAIVLIMLGTNDSKPHNWNALEYERELAGFVELYKNLPSHPIVYLLTPPKAFIPKGKKEVAFKISNVVIENEIVPIAKRVAGEMNVSVIDVFSATQEHPECFPDGVHPNAVGNKAIAKAVHRALTSQD